jgi:MoxR-like ATPase
MDIKGVKLAIDVARKIGRTPHIVGLHGTGKSSVVKQWCQENGYDMIDVRLGQMADAGDIIGLPEFHSDAHGKFTKYVLPDFFPRKEKVVIFLDEINRASKDLLQAVFELVYDKSIKGNKLPKDCFVIAASNPATDDYAVLDFSDSAFQDRFIHMKFTPSQKEFHSYMRSKFPNSNVLEFLSEQDKLLEDGGLQSFQLDFVKPSRRSWEAVLEMEVLREAGEIDDALFTELAMGIVGLHAAPALMTFLKTNVGSIKSSDVFANYAKVKKNVVKCVEKGRTDIIGTLITSIGDDLSKMKGLELSEAQNLIELVSDLSPEQAYTLCTLFTGIGQTACENVNGMSEGLLNNDELVGIMTKTMKVREQLGKEIEAAKTGATTGKKRGRPAKYAATEEL